jgi:DNA-directed RNA polymerase specialized sigma24 family protein
LVGAAQRGDSSAWPELIDRFENIAVAAAARLYGDLDEAPDIAQEAFVLAFRHIADLRDPAAFPAWLLRLVRTVPSRMPILFVNTESEIAGPAAVGGNLLKWR